VKFAYPLGRRWSTQVHLLNGWQVIADNNRGKSLGCQFAYAAGKFSPSFNGIVGPEQPDNDHDRWAGVGLYARLAPPEAKTAFAVRDRHDQMLLLVGAVATF
jgi:hypothetical protein